MIGDQTFYEMNQEEAQRWFEIGGRIVVLNVPPGTQVGVDMNSWTVGERFRGVKFLPKHLHFVHWAPVGKEGRGQGPRTGMFLWMSPAETVVLRWDAQTEDVERSQDVDEIQRCRDDHRGLDPFLGPYPHGGELARWVSLSGHITESLWRRLEPTDGKINPSDDQALRFTPFPSPCYPPGATPAEITRHSLDHSYSLGIMLQSMTGTRLKRKVVRRALIMWFWMCRCHGDSWRTRIRLSVLLARTFSDGV